MARWLEGVVSNLPRSSISLLPACPIAVSSGDARQP